LIAFRSTHNFLDQEMAKGLGIQPMHQEAIKVKVTNRDEIVSSGKCKNIKIKMQGIFLWLIFTSYLWLVVE
jgi:hypothetical protein